MTDSTTEKTNWFSQHKIITGIIAFIFLITIFSAMSGGTDTENKSLDNTSSQNEKEGSNKTEEKAPEREVAGEKATIGTGTFEGGTDVKAGLYDVTAGAGESGNFIVNDGASYNEILGDGLGVNKIRVKVSTGDKIKISGLSNVTFTPVKSKFVTKYKTVELYAGTFVVGEDIGQGRYTVTAGAGESGNFIVNDGASYNEILGGDYGVENVAATLNNGDKITISGMSQVNFTAKD